MHSIDTNLKEFLEN